MNNCPIEVLNYSLILDKTGDKYWPNGPVVFNMMKT